MDLPEQSKRLYPKTIRRVFRDWDSLKTLGENPLADLPVILRHRHGAGFTPSTVGNGLALREVFQAALESLKPDEGAPNLQEKRWRPYIILTEQYLHGRNPEWVKEQLHVSKGTYYGEQERALDMLAEVLQRWDDECREGPLGNHPENYRIPFMTPPRSAYNLVGRDDLLFQLKQEFIDGNGQTTLALEGLPGVGKTAIAVELAHDPDILARFPDGVLWAGLGSHPDLLALLGTWAEAVGVSGEVIGSRSDPVERAEIIHAAISARSLLLIIDDAWQTESALAFKLGGPNCAYLVTTRLAEIAIDFAGERVMTVHELDRKDGIRLLAQIAPRAVEASPREFPRLVDSVGGLPLALILIGRYLQKQSFRDQFRRLHAALTGLEAPEARLKVSQPPSPFDGLRSNLPSGTPLSLQAVIGLSDEDLDPVARQALRDLSLFAPKPNSFSEASALAVTASPVVVLDRLVDCGLVESIGQERYTLHQTIADFASLNGAAPDAAARMVDYYLGYVEAHADKYHDLDPELKNILSALEFAKRSPRPEQLIRLVNRLYSFLETRGLYQVSEEALGLACKAAEDCGDKAGQAEALYNLGDLETKRGQFKAAQGYLMQCIPLAQATQSRNLEANSLFQLGLASHYAGDYQNGRSSLQQSLQIVRELGSRSDEGFTLTGLGFAYEEMGEFHQALAHLEQALQVCAASGNRRGEGWAHYNLSMVYLPMGVYPLAMSHAEECQKVYREIGDRRGMGWLFYHLGRIQRQRGDYAQARDNFDLARQTLDDIGDWMGMGFSIHNLGLIAAELGNDAAANRQIKQAMEIFQRIDCMGICQSDQTLGVMRRRNGDYRGALPYFERALSYWREIGYRRGEAQTLVHLGLDRFYLGDYPAALDYAHQALRMLEEMGARPNQALALTFLGQIELGLGRLDEAAESYQRASTIRIELGQPWLALEPQAGLTRISLQKGDLSQASTQTEEILAYLETKGASAPIEYVLAGMDQPLQVYLTCYQILAARRDPRAEGVLKTAAQVMQKRLSQIEDEQQKRSFIENVPVNQEIWKRFSAN